MVKKIYQGVLNLPDRLFPKFVKSRIDTERWSVDTFVKKNIQQYVETGMTVLDAGAGPHRFREHIKERGATYVATDFEDVFFKGSPDSYDFVCSLDNIPQPDNTYDVIINTQVLEHVEYPQKVVSELYRVLKPGGKLIFTTNMMFWVHHGPYNYFYFTNYGLTSLFKQAGFTVDNLEARGGAMWFLAKLCTFLPSYLYYQVVYGGYKVDESFVPKMRSPILTIVLLPVYLLSKIIIGNIIPFILFYLDGFDRQKSITLGHQVICTKR